MEQDRATKDIPKNTTSGENICSVSVQGDSGYEPDLRVASIKPLSLK